jgi:hypothetical protein
VDQTRINWRQGKNLTPASGCPPIIPDYDFS